ncbi:50S ribosomal protein S18 (plastid) [Bigelowiella natans]|uniref:Small ribosomal subunit protein bS18c n=1 Tax=Bigelowiella natans TaxID=227086 RepID=RR18_BIGNA|nr:50S ribosomal protein S18 [Bigelowiella natans]Q06J55.1 RecName: Full=Small ribosomal subunit protein bS18c; AltName: Full=30S ribosomal protein S18, chloroplastic [Bigelowiella natans]ABG91404.1 50S ribosomal protein S18 [Bigelowiella natans]
MKNLEIKRHYNLDYKNTNLLKKFVSVDGKILPKYITVLKPKNQRKLSKAIKLSRIAGLLKFLNN